MGEHGVDLSHVEAILERYEKVESSLIPVLQEVRGGCGSLREEAIVRISRGLNVALSRIYGVVTFYSQFYLNPRGLHTVRVCRGTACHVRGGKHVLRAVEQALELNEGETTPDFKFTFETVACLGACALAPVLLVDKTYYGKLTPARVEQVLRQY